MITEILQYENKIKWKVKTGDKWVEKHDLTQSFLEDLSISKNQTRQLYNAYIQFGDPNKISIFDKVNIMTPENIHVNSFMYEPLLDMDITELKCLYDQIKDL